MPQVLGQDVHEVATRDDLLKLFASALGSTTEGQKALDAIRKNKPDAFRFARVALTSLFSESVQESLAPVLKEVHEISQAVDKSLEWQAELTGGQTREILDLLLPHGALWHRFTTDSPQQKAALADYLVRTYLNKPCRCFVQASTTAIHLGQKIGQSHVPGSLFHTNSTVFPFTVLREGSPHQVYAFCGPDYDQVCAGWLFNPRYETTKRALQDLFEREQEPLQTAFVFPLAMTLDGGPAFARMDTAFLVQTLMEKAPHTIFAVTTDRLHEKMDGLAKDKPWNRAVNGDWAAFAKKASLVTIAAGHAARGDELAAAFRRKSLEVHLSAGNGEWRTL